MFGVRVDAEVAGLGVIDGGDDVPGGAAAAEVVEGREGARHVERLVVGGGVGGTQPEVVGGGGHRAEDGREVELDGAGTAQDRLIGGVAVDRGHREAVIEEHQVELAVLESAGDALVVAQVEVIGGRAGVTPRAGEHRHVGCLHERDECELVGT